MNYNFVFNEYSISKTSKLLKTPNQRTQTYLFVFYKKISKKEKSYITDERFQTRRPPQYFHQNQTNLSPINSNPTLKPK